MYSYFNGHGRFALMGTALINSSDMLLHAAKALHCADIPALSGLEDAVFNALLATYFVCNVALPPWSLVKTALLDSRHLKATSYATTNGLVLMIYGLQLFWFYKLVRIALKRRARGSGEARPSRACLSQGTPTAHVTLAGGEGKNKAQ